MLFLGFWLREEEGVWRPFLTLRPSLLLVQKSLFVSIFEGGGAAQNLEGGGGGDFFSLLAEGSQDLCDISLPF